MSDGDTFDKGDIIGEDDILVKDDGNDSDDIVCEDNISCRLIVDIFEDACADLDNAMGEVVVFTASLLIIVADAESGCVCVLSDWVLFLVGSDVL